MVVWIHGNRIGSYRLLVIVASVIKTFSLGFFLLVVVAAVVVAVLFDVRFVDVDGGAGAGDAVVVVFRFGCCWCWWW